MQVGEPLLSISKQARTALVLASVLLVATSTVASAVSTLDQAQDETRGEHGSFREPNGPDLHGRYHRSAGQN
jgi:hypothetical protein